LEQRGAVVNECHRCFGGDFRFVVVHTAIVWSTWASVKYHAQKVLLAVPVRNFREGEY
jgi:hypothetical protein